MNSATFFMIEGKRVGRWGLLFGGLVIMTLSMRTSLTDMSHLSADIKI